MCQMSMFEFAFMAQKLILVSESAFSSKNCKTVVQQNTKRMGKLLNAIVFIACSSFVLWQCYLSFVRLIEKPSATSIKIEYAKNWPVPSFTVCPKDMHYRRNETVLKECGGFSGKYDR